MGAYGNNLRTCTFAELVKLHHVIHIVKNQLVGAIN